jgi:hypothetical protein
VYQKTISDASGRYILKKNPDQEYRTIPDALAMLF